MELALFVGLQASGKTSFYVERFLATHAHLSLDVLKTRHRERRFLEVCLETRMPVVVDNTNPTRSDRRKYVEPASAAGYGVHLYFFQSRLAECLERNRARALQSRVPERGVRATSARLEIPSREEGFDTMRFVHIRPEGGFAVEEWRDEV